MRVISSSKGQQAPLPSRFQKVGLVTMDPSEKIFPSLLKQVGSMENLVQRSLRAQDRYITHLKEPSFHGGLGLVRHIEEER